MKNIFQFMKALKSYFPIVLLFLFSSIVFKAFGQELPKMEWNKVSKDDLQMKVWANDSTADAAVLGDYGHLMMTDVPGNYHGFILTKHYRIKIFNKQAFDRANIVLLYYANNDYEYFLKIKAQTVLPNGTRIPVETKDFRTEKLNKYYSVKKFTFPNVVEGAVLEYEYELSSRNVFSLTSWAFQHDIPTRFSLLDLHVKSRFSYNSLFQGKEYIKQTAVKYDYDNHKNYALESLLTHYSYYALDLPALKKEAFITTINDYVIKVDFQLAERIDENGNRRKVVENWEKTNTELLERSDFGEVYLKKAKFDDLLKRVKPLINLTDSTLQKINILYNWVNENFEFNDVMDFSADFSPNELLKKRRANSGELNLILVALLREVGVEANPVILSTRQNGKPFYESAFLRQYNHTIAHVELNGKPLLMDCGNINRPPGILRTEAYNDKGYLVRKKDSKWIDIVPPISSQVSNVNVELTEDGKFKGIVTALYKGILAAEKRQQTGLDSTTNTLKKILIKNNPEWSIDSIVFKNLDKVKESFQQNIYLTINNVGQISNDLIYLKPTLQSGWETNPFKNPVRIFPVEFAYPNNEQFVLNMKIPKGYKIEELPKQVSLTLPPDDGKFQYLITERDNVINLVVKINLKKTVFPSDVYPYLKRFFDDIAAKLNEQIVLKKISN
jgi:Domain of Unknown Function with PDB structure (DUF3857)/Transglutaminase-like superfamily